MNDLAIGRALRVLRQRLGWRQVDVAIDAGVSQQLISKIERGRSSRVSSATLRRVFAAVDADVVTYVRWRGGELDRLLDEGHASIVGSIATLLRRRGWQVLTEVTFSDYGERGSVDVLAWHPATRTLLVVEVKTEITSAEELLPPPRYEGSARPEDRHGPVWAAACANGSPLVVGDMEANRRRIARLSLRVRHGISSPPPATFGDGCVSSVTPLGGVSSSRSGRTRVPLGSRSRVRRVSPGDDRQRLGS